MFRVYICLSLLFGGMLPALSLLMPHPALGIGWIILCVAISGVFCVLGGRGRANHTVETDPEYWKRK